MGILAEQLATLVAAVAPRFPVASGDLGFGSDISCTTDVTSSMAEVSGVAVVTEAIYRRLITPRGELVGDPDYGYDVRGLLAKGMTPAQLYAVQGAVAAEVLKDDRIDTASAVLTRTGSRSFSLAVSGTCAAGPYALTLAVTDGQALLQEMNG